MRTETCSYVCWLIQQPWSLLNQALFSDINRPIDDSYVRIVEQEYEKDHLPVNNRNPGQAVKSINDHISFRAQGETQNIVKPGDLCDAQLLLTSAIFFKGKWKVRCKTKSKINLIDFLSVSMEMHSTSVKHGSKYSIATMVNMWHTFQ